jgi:hypothetical protein
MLRRYLTACLILIATQALAQGGLEVRVLSAKVVPNPKSEFNHDFKPSEVLQLEVVGTDRSGATTIEPRDKDIALYDCNGQEAARYLYHIDDATHYVRDDDPRTEVRSKLIFMVPQAARQQYSLRWTVTRYAQRVTTFNWTGTALKAPLQQERDGVTVLVNELKLGHPAATEIADWHLDEAKAAKMAADHLILSIRSSGLRHDAMKLTGVNAVEISTGADGQVVHGDPLLDLSRTSYSGYPANGTAGKVYPLTADTICHFLDTTTIPKITRLTISISREIPFEEGWAAVNY